EVGCAVDDAEVVHLQDVRVLEAEERLELALEALAQLGLVAELFVQDLDGDGRPVLLLGLVDGAHVPLTEDGEDLVMLVDVPADEAEDAGAMTFRFHRRMFGSFAPPIKTQRSLPTPLPTRSNSLVSHPNG